MAANGATPADIAQGLNAEGMLTLQRRPWSKETVAAWIARLKKKGAWSPQ
jgi:predicted transcriptional regulator